jgi:hypothetical protein
MIQVPNPWRNDASISFWELNPEYILIFEDFHKKDRSKGKLYSSTVMWAMYLKLHPESSFYNMSNKEEFIKTKFVKDDKFDWTKYEDIELLFRDTILTQAEKSLFEWNELMHKRDKYLKSKDYYFDEYATDENGDNIITKTGNFVTIKGTAEQLDKAQQVTIKYFNEYTKILKELNEEKLKRGKGNKPLSSSDANRI